MDTLASISDRTRCTCSEFIYLGRLSTSFKRLIFSSEGCTSLPSSFKKERCERNALRLPLMVFGDRFESRPDGVGHISGHAPVAVQSPYSLNRFQERNSKLLFACCLDFAHFRLSNRLNLQEKGGQPAELGTGRGFGATFCNSNGSTGVCRQPPKHR